MRTLNIAHLVRTVKGEHAIAASTAPSPHEPITINLKGLMRIDGFDGTEYPELYLNDKLIFIRKSLKFASHFYGISWGIDWNDIKTSERACLQTSLAVCIEIYGVSNAITAYKYFSKKYMETLPFNQSFNQTLTIKL